MVGREATSNSAPELSSGRDVVRSMIYHEDQLRNERLGWFLTLNGLLFAGLSFAWSARDAAWLVAVVGAVGVCVAITALAAMWISDHAISRLRTWADKYDNGKDPSLPPIVGLRGDDVPWYVHLIAPWTALPWVFLIAWPILIVIRVRTR